MKIILENEYLVSSINLLQGIKLKGTDSLARSKFVKLLANAVQKLSVDEHELINQFGEPENLSKPVGDDNPVRMIGDNQYAIRASVRNIYQQEHKRLLEQRVELEGGTYVDHIKDIMRIIDDYAKVNELAGDNAMAYLELREALKAGEQTDD